MSWTQSENISFWIQVKLVLGRVLTVRGQEGAHWDAEDFPWCMDVDRGKIS